MRARSRPAAAVRPAIDQRSLVHPPAHRAGALALTAPLALTAAFALLASASACAAGRAYLGDVTLRPYGDPILVPTSYGVERGRILSPDLDASVGSDGCLRGTIQNDGLQLCPQQSPRAPEHAGDLLQRWSGTSGDFTLELSPDGTRLRMDGYLRRSGASVPLAATLALGRGPQWDELRKDPVLLAVAAALTGISGEPTGSDLSLSR